MGEDRRLAFLLRAWKRGAVCGDEKSNFTTASLPSLSAAFSASSMPAPSMPPRRPDSSASPRPASTNCARLGRAAVRPSTPSPAAVPTGASGADSVRAFLQQFVPLGKPLNFQLVADEMKRLFGFVRARSSVETFLITHLPLLLPAPPPRIRIYRKKFARSR